MGWFTDLMENIDRPSNALQGLAVGGIEGLKRGWKQEENYDFEQLGNKELAKKGWSEREGFGEKGSYLLSSVANLIFDPINILPVGMIAKGIKGAGTAVKAGANVEKGAMRGALPSSVPNYIQGRYNKPTARTVEVAEKIKSGLLSDTLRFTTPHQKNMLVGADMMLSKHLVDTPRYKMAKVASGRMKTGGIGLKNYMKMMADPEARALYRSEGINKYMLTDAQKLSNKADKEIELVHRAFYNMHILEQSGKVGSKQLLKDFSSLLGVHGYQPYAKGSYHKLSKGYGGGVKEATKAEHKYIEKHIGSVWKDKKGLPWREGVPFSKAKNTKIFIKKGHGGKGGAHYSDITMRNQSFGDIAKILGDSQPKNLEELKKLLDNGKYTSAKTKPTYTIDEKTGNVWAEFGDKGSSITEGGTNVLLGIKPSGKFVMTISDEHNFLENIPILGYVISKMLPNRLLAVTPPMVDDIRKFKHQTMGVPKPDDSIPFQLNRPLTYQEQVTNALRKDTKLTWGEELDTLRKAKATPQDLAYERARQMRGSGIAGLGGGMLVGGSSE